MTTIKKHTLVVGGTKGVGKAIAQAFSKEGHAVSVIGRKKPEESIKNVDCWELNLSDQKAVQKTLNSIVKKNGKLNNVIFLQRYRGNDDDKEGNWQGELDISLTATKIIIEQLAGMFADSSEKSIVIVSSLAADFIFNEQPLGYHVAKAGLNQLAVYYAATLAKKGIRVNCITPSTILKDESKEFYLRNKSLHELYKKITPLGRMCTPEDITSVALFLCSAKASFITGQNIIVDGGLSLQSHESVARQITGLGHSNLVQRKK